MNYAIAAVVLLFGSSLLAQNNAIFQGGTSDGYARGGAAQLVSTSGIFSGGFGDGYMRNGFAQPISTVGLFSGGEGDGYTRTGFAQPLNTVGLFNGGAGDGYVRNNGTNVKVSIQGLAFLEGPYNSGTLMMNDNLRIAGLVPLTEPYTAMGYAQAGGGGGETTNAGTLAISGNGAVVDWVRIELRDATTPTTLIATRQALLLRDATVLSASTGDDFIELNAAPGNYYVVVRHRNHLGAMTAAPVALTGTPTNIDFSLPSTATFGTTAQRTIGTKNAMWAGDVTGNHQIKYTGSANDRDPILVKVGSTTPNNTVNGQYTREDVNMDATVKYTGSANDRDPILVNVGSTTPNNTRAEQVP